MKKNIEKRNTIALGRYQMSYGKSTLAREAVSYNPTDI
jgi:hypothetical protein